MEHSAKITELTNKYEALSKDDELERICLWVQPNSDDPFDDATLLEGNDQLLRDFFEMDTRSTLLGKRKVV